MRLDVCPRLRIELRPGDEIVSSTLYRDYVLVFTKMGHIYQVVHRQ